MISVPPAADDAFVHVPSGLGKPYLEGVLSRSSGRDISVSDCTTTNLCAGKFGGVSNSGATVLRLSLELAGGDSIDLVAKILSPDAVNLFKIDCRFDSRLAEVLWAKWWGRQKLSWVPVVYDTRADTKTREFWIIHEYFPQVGWPGFSAEKPKGMGHFSADPAKLRSLFRQIALLHAYSSQRVTELNELFDQSGLVSLNSCPGAALESQLARTAADSPLLTMIGVTEEERQALATFCRAIRAIPEWVGDWDMVCVVADWGPDNFGIRESDDRTLVNYDWGTTRLAPMEEDLDVILRRIREVGPDVQMDLLSYYLQVYADQTGRRVDRETFMSRIPWARFLVTLRYLLGHVEALRWVPHQTRSREFVHLFIDLGKRYLAECRKDTSGPNPL